MSAANSKKFSVMTADHGQDTVTASRMSVRGGELLLWGSGVDEIVDAYAAGEWKSASMVLEKKSD